MIARTLFVLLCFTTTSAVAQRIVDPSKVAPEFREAAQERRAQQIKQHDCAKKAEIEKIAVRDRTDFILRCLEEK